MSTAFYQANVKKAKENIQKLEKTINRNSLLRLAIILIGGIVIFQLFKINNVFVVLGTIMLIMLLFVYLVFRQSRVERQLQEAKIYLKVNENEIAIKEGNANMYADGAEFDDGKHPYVSDLDIFGSNSLFALVNRCSSKDAVLQLKNWFASPASKKDILERQEAIQELKEDPEHLQAFQTKMLFNLGSKINLSSYIASYFHDQSFKFGNAALKAYVTIVPFIFLAGILFSIFVHNIGSYLIFLAIAHLLWTIAMAGRISQFSNKIDKVGASLLGFADGIKLIEDKTFQATLSKNIQQQIKVEKQDKKLSSIIAELGKLIDKLDARNNMLVGAILNMLFLWDFKQVMAIAKWKDQYEDSILNGFEAVSVYECLISLSVLSYNNPEWATPVILDNYATDKIVTEAIEHPLIKKGRSVANDYNATDHQIALITGSNMAGKSTFLRTIGINAVLAYTGAVVCAKSLRLPIYSLVSYMRIKDSLNESTSTFKAELDRMKFILDQVSNQKDTFFLIDEMLRGTNSVDKYLGSKAIIKKLIGLDGRGMLATHDLQLADLAQQYPQVIRNYHFDIQVRASEMLFDYKLKDGACTIFNASMLLKGIGVVVESEKDA
ncbi:MutS-related protein [Sphingobacterium kyonggiense]